MRIDMTGQRFGRWLVVGPSDDRTPWMKGNGAVWLCRCACGTERAVHGVQLRRGSSQSCGCIQREKAAALHHVHGAAPGRSGGYSSWQNMRARCLNPNHSHYAFYGGRGITICERWNDFREFIADLGTPAPGMTLERIDVDGPYSPENCRWATRAEQMRNTRRSISLSHEGRTQPAADWAAELGIPYDRLYYLVRKHGPDAGLAAAMSHRGASIAVTNERVSQPSQ